MCSPNFPTNSPDPLINSYIPEVKPPSEPSRTSQVLFFNFQELSDSNQEKPTSKSLQGRNITPLKRAKPVNFKEVLKRTLPDISRIEYKLRMRMFSRQIMNHDICEYFGLIDIDQITQEHRINFALGIFPKSKLIRFQGILLPGSPPQFHHDPDSSEGSDTECPLMFEME